MLSLILAIGEQHYSERPGSTARLVCFTGDSAPDSLNIAALPGAYTGDVHLDVTITALGMPEKQEAQLLSKGLHIDGDDPSMLSFDMDSAEGVGRFVFEADDAGDDTLLIARVFPQTHRCMRKVSELGCMTASHLLDCLSSHARGVDAAGAINTQRTDLMPAYTLTISRKAVLTISEASYPSIDNTTWFVLVTCADMGPVSCNRTMTMKVQQDDSTDWKLAGGVLFMCLVPMCFLVLMVYIRELLIELSAWVESSRRASSRPGWRETCLDVMSNGRRELASLCTSTSTRRHGKTLLLLGSAYFTTAIQFVITRWSAMIRTGNRDVCYFNEACFLPFMIWDVPFNKFISHIPYFVCSGFIFIAVLNAEAKWRRLFIPGVITPLDLSIFYALCLSLALEGVGSMCYHLCPGLEVFQFDTAFMIPIAHLSMFALLEEAAARQVESSGLGTSMVVEMSRRSSRAASSQAPDGSFRPRASTAGEDESDDSAQGSLGRNESIPSVLTHHRQRIPSPYQYFLCVVCPMWMFNFLGTWFDVDLIRHGKRYVAFLVAMGLWAWWIVGYLSLFFPESNRLWPARALKLLLLAALLANLVSYEVRTNVGGTANLLLLLSIIAMGWVTVAQLCTLDVGLSVVKLSTQGRRSVRAGMVSRGILGTSLKFASRYCLEGSFIIVCVIAVKAFTAHATDVLTSPAKSRNLNTRCLLTGAFDSHDCWHLLSAIALALWVLSLLHTRLRIWMRVWQCGNSFIA